MPSRGLRVYEYGRLDGVNLVFVERVLWISLAVSYFLVCRAPELYAGIRNGKVYKEFCLIRGDICFVWGITG